MSDAVFQRSVPIDRPRAARPVRVLPRGFGLVFGAAVSLGLWFGIFWIVARAFG